MIVANKIIKLITGLILIAVVSFFSPTRLIGQAINQKQVFEYIEISRHNWEAQGSTVRIDSNGEVAYIFMESPGMGKQAKGKLEPSELKELINLIENTDLYALENEYKAQYLSRSGSSYYLTLKTNLGIKKISFYSKGEAVEAFPKILSEIVNKVETITQNIAESAFKTENVLIQ